MNSNKGYAFLMIVIILLIIAFIGLFIYVKSSYSTQNEQLSNLQSSLDSLTNKVTDTENDVLITNTEVNTPDPTPSTPSTPTTPTTPTIKDTITVDLTYATLELPSSWKGKYSVSTSSSDNVLKFQFKSLANASYGGHVFSIWIEQASLNTVEESGVPECKLVKSNTKYKIFCVRPSDVQFSNDGMTEYTSLQNSIDSILETIEFK